MEELERKLYDDGILMKVETLIIKKSSSQSMGWHTGFWTKLKVSS